MASTKSTAMPVREDSVTIQMRAKPSQREIIDRAAEVLGKNRTEFVMDAAVTEAQKVLLDQTIFHLDESAWAELSAILDAPAERNPKLAKLFQHKSPWEA